MPRLIVKDRRIGVVGGRLVTDAGGAPCCCDGGGETDPPPPIGCCVESTSVDCTGRTRRCRGGKNVRYTLRTESESLELANNGTFRWFQRRTELILMRAYCPAQGFVVIEADLANSYIEYYSERTGQANTYVRTQPHPFVPGSRFRSPGNSPLVTDGGDPRPCVESFFDGTYNVSRNLVSRCQDGSYLETRQSIFDAQYSRTEYVWSWVTSIECDRPPGPGLLPPGLDPLTLRPVVPGCPGCGA